MPTPSALRHPLAGLPTDLRRQLGVLFVGRGTGSWTLRFAYPFLPTIARGLEIELAHAAALLGVVELLGLLAPAVGRRVDRGDKRLWLVAGSATSGVGGVVAGTVPGTAGFASGVIVLGAGFITYTVASSSWTGSRVPIDRRGGAIGLLETSWALSFLLGAPAAAALITAGSWRTPFVVIGVINLAVAVVIARTIPSVAAAPSDATTSTPSRPWAYAATLGLLGFGGMMVIGTHGAWLEDAHGFDVERIGVLAVLLGAAELVGSGISMLWGDGIGLRRTMMLGLAVLAPAVALTAAIGGTTPGAALMLFAVFAAFEVAFVAGLTIASELDISARGAALGIAIAGATLGRAVGAYVGVRLFEESGMATAGIVGAIAISGALLMSRRSIPVAAAPRS